LRVSGFDEVIPYGKAHQVAKAGEVHLVAVDHVRHHQPYFTSQLAMSMSQNFLHGSSAAEESLIPGAPLTPCEVEVVQLLADGRSNKEVATELGVSTRTVESHRNHIMRKTRTAPSGMR